MTRNAHSRRDFVALLASLGCAPGLTAQSSVVSSGSAHNLPIYDLGLPPAVLADLQEFAQEVIRDVHYLDELELEGVSDALVFIPR